MVYIVSCEICNKVIEIEGNEPHRCPQHTVTQMVNRKKQKLDLDTVDFLLNKYNPTLVGF